MSEKEVTMRRSPPWIDWLQQGASVVYLIAGIFLLYYNRQKFHRRGIFVVGLLFIAYSVYRFFLIRRWIQRRRREEEPR